MRSCNSNYVRNVETRAGTTRTFEYDAVGNRTKRTAFIGRVTTYEYDNLNRLKKINYLQDYQGNAPPTPISTVSYTYDDFSRLATAANAAGTVAFTYDSRNRLKTETDVFSHVIEYAYDAAGRRSLLKLDGSNYATYSYDNANRLTGITNVSDSTTVGYGYNNTNQVTSRTYPNGVTTTYDYDGMSRLTRIKDVNTSATLFDRQYSYNSANQISQIVEPSLTKDFGYDNSNQLTSVTNGGSGESYAFDAVGNRSTSHLSSSYSYSPFNRLTATDTASFNFDANGNTVEKSEGSNFWRYTWDAENRLAEASTRKQKVRYVYDALGRRVRRHIPGTKELTKFTYDGDDVILDDDLNSGTTKYVNGPGIDNKLRSTTSSSVRYLLADHLGSTNGLTNSSGTLTDSNSYDSFGNPSDPTFPSRYGFTGRGYDSFSALQYSRARFYDPKIGRFTSEDPIGFGSGAVNIYGYVGNNALNATDPTGLYEIDVHYYLTYYLAMKTGCFSNYQASQIADGNQRTDEDPATAPSLGAAFQNSVYHALSPEAKRGAFGPDWSGFGGSSFSSFGRALHYYQDSYSHEGFSNPYYGHARALHYIDKTESDPTKAMEMARGTFELLAQFGRSLGCTCNSKFTPEMGNTIWNFVNLPAAYFPGLFTIDNQGNSTSYLNDKRRMLGVPYRFQW